MTLITEKPLQFANCQEAYDKIQKIFDLSEASGRAVSPDKKLCIVKEENFFQVIDHGTFPQPSCTVTLRSDSITGRLPTKDLSKDAALEFLSQFVARWELGHNRAVEVDPSFVVSSQQELRFRARIENGEPPIESAKDAWIPVNDLLKGPQKLHVTRGIDGNNGRGITISYAGDKSGDIIVVNQIRPGGAYGSEMRDQTVLVSVDGTLKFTDPQTGKKEGAEALYELNRMIKLLLRNSSD